MLLYTTQRSGRTGRRRHGCERRRELRVEIRRRRSDQRVERVGVRGVVGRHARPPPQFLHCFLERRDELVGHVGHLLDFPVQACVTGTPSRRWRLGGRGTQTHRLRRESVLVDRFWGPRGRRWRGRRRRRGNYCGRRGRRPRDAPDSRGRRGRRARARAAAPPWLPRCSLRRVARVADMLCFGPALRPPALRRPVVVARRRRPRHGEQEVDFRRRFHVLLSTKVSGHWSKLRLVQCGSGSVSTLTRRRRCFGESLRRLISARSSNRRSRTSSQVGKFTRNPIYARGTVDKIQVTLEPREHPITPPL